MNAQRLRSRLPLPCTQRGNQRQCFAKLSLQPSCDDELAFRMSLFTPLQMSLKTRGRVTTEESFLLLVGEGMLVAITLRTH